MVAQITAILFSRLILFVLLFSASLFFLPAETFVSELLVIYALTTVIYLVSILFWFKSRQGYPVGLLLYFCILLEILLESVIILNTGGIFSNFSLLYFLSIISAGLFFQLRGSLSIATVTASIFLILGAYHLNHFGFLDVLVSSGVERLKSSAPADEIYLNVYISLCFFYVIAVLSGYLSQRLKSQLHELDQVKINLREILENMTSGLLYLNRDGIILYSNKIAEQLLGWKEGYRFNQHYRQVITHSQAVESLDQLYRDPALNFVTLEQPLLVNDPLAYYQISLNALHKSDQQMQGAIVSFQNITSLKRMEEKVLKKEKMATVGELSARMAHEIKNPLASISGSIQVLQQELILEHENQTLMNVVVKETDRLDRLLKNFLLYAREQRVEPQLLSLDDLLKEVTTLLKNQAADFHTLSIDYRAQPITIESDEHLLKQIFMNLGINALQAMQQKGGVLKIELNPNGEKIDVKFIDQGPGIVPDILIRIFEPFFTTKPHSSGLGLAICYSFIQRLKGALNVSNNSPGPGATFVVSLQKNWYPKFQNKKSLLLTGNKHE